MQPPAGAFTAQLPGAPLPSAVLNVSAAMEQLARHLEARTSRSADPLVLEARVRSLMETGRAPPANVPPQRASPSELELYAGRGQVWALAQAPARSMSWPKRASRPVRHQWGRAIESPPPQGCLMMPEQGAQLRVNAAPVPVGRRSGRGFSRGAAQGIMALSQGASKSLWELAGCLSLRLCTASAQAAQSCLRWQASMC